MRKRVFASIAALVGLVILGAVGSGVWEMLLRDLVLWVGYELMELVATIFSGYLEFLHHDIGQVRSNDLVLLPFVGWLTVMTIGPIFGVLLTLAEIKRVKSKLRDMKNDLERESAIELEDLATRRSNLEAQVSRLYNWVKWLGTGFCIIAIFFATHNFLRALYVESARDFVERSIVVLTPHLKSQDVSNLWAQYRNIQDADSFYRLEERLRSYGKELGVQLPSQFESIKAKDGATRPTPEDGNEGGSRRDNHSRRG